MGIKTLYEVSSVHHCVRFGFVNTIVFLSSCTQRVVHHGYNKGKDCSLLFYTTARYGHRTFRISKIISNASVMSRLPYVFGEKKYVRDISRR